MTQTPAITARIKRHHRTARERAPPEIPVLGHHTPKQGRLVEGRLPDARPDAAGSASVDTGSDPLDGRGITRVTFGAG
jgi:hypothetical protein